MKLRNIKKSKYFDRQDPGDFIVCNNFKNIFLYISFINNLNFYNNYIYIILISLMYGTLSRYYIEYTLYNRTIKTNQNTFRSIRKASKL